MRVKVKLTKISGKLLPNNSDELSLDIDISALNLNSMDGYIYAWIDINGDGVFSESEFVSVLVPKGTNAGTFTVSFPQNMFTGATAKNTYFRLRVTTDPLVNDNLNPLVVDTRSFDYASNGDVIDRPIRITYTTLPVELIKFTTTRKKDHTLLQWSTSSETNHQYFIVERSNNGYDNWIEVNKVETPINNDLIKNYEYKDINSNQTVYYRLKQVDIDGQETIYGIYISKHIAESTIETMNIYPNPFVSQFTLETILNETGQYILEIFSLNGNKYHQQYKIFEAGTQKTNINPPANMPTGSYVLKLSKDGRMIQSKIFNKQ